MSIILNGSGGVTTTSGAAYDGLQRATAQAAAGAAIDFGNIPSWVSRITLMFHQISTNTTSPPIIQLGTSTGIEITGYNNANTVTASGVGTVSNTTGFIIGLNTASWAASYTVSGTFVITNLNGNIWAISGSVGDTSAARMYFTAGSKELAAPLTQVRITTVGGGPTNTFDGSGLFNIIYE